MCDGQQTKIENLERDTAFHTQLAQDFFGQMAQNPIYGELTPDDWAYLSNYGIQSVQAMPYYGGQAPYTSPYTKETYTTVPYIGLARDIDTYFAQRRIAGQYASGMLSGGISGGGMGGTDTTTTAPTPANSLLATGLDSNLDIIPGANQLLQQPNVYSWV